MTDTRLRLWSRGLGAIVVAMSLVGAGFSIASGDAVRTYGVLSLITLPVVGVVIIRSQPRNRVGWVFIASGLLNGSNGAGDRIGSYALAHHWPEAVSHVAELATITWFPGLFLLITLGLLYFPQGLLPGRVWRWFAIASVALMGLWTVCIAAAAWQLPAKVLASSASPDPTGWRHVVFVIGTAAIPGILPCVIAAVISLVVRWRRSDAMQRLQIRWVATAGVVAVVAEIAVDAFHVGNDAQTIIESTAFGLIAVATAVAILRYHLYDIDRIISRTVSYATITVLLGATYVGIVALAGTFIPARYGSVGVAAATLVVAALFVPARRRVQRLIDRRFDRSHYDSSRTVDRFAVTMRSDLTQAELTDELLTTVQRAVSPSTATVWLVDDRRGRALAARDQMSAG